MFFACDLARFLVIRAFLVLVNPLSLLGLWHDLKVFSLFRNFLSTMGFRALGSSQLADAPLLAPDLYSLCKRTCHPPKFCPTCRVMGLLQRPCCLTWRPGKPLANWSIHIAGVSGPVARSSLPMAVLSPCGLSTLQAKCSRPISKSPFNSHNLSLQLHDATLHTHHIKLCTLTQSVAEPQKTYRLELWKTGFSPARSTLKEWQSRLPMSLNASNPPAAQTATKKPSCF